MLPPPKPPVLYLDAGQCSLARRLFTSIFQHWLFLLSLPISQFQAMQQIAGQLNRTLLAELFANFEHELIEVCRLIATGSPSKIGRFIKNFSSSPNRCLFADLHDLLRGEPRATQRRRVATVWRRKFKALACLKGPELIEAVLNLMCGPSRAGEDVSGEALCHLIRTLKKLDYLTMQFARFDSAEAKECEERRALPEPVVIEKYRAFVTEFEDVCKEIAEMLQEIQLAFTLELTLEDVQRARKAAQSNRSIHSTELFIWRERIWPAQLCTTD